jgi:two-component system, OmpR family, phosphate regulon response regulator OmpR
MPQTILIIDDDTRLAGMLADYLGQAGFVTRHAGTGQEGLNDLQRAAPDAVILDVMLPDFDGFEVLRRLRQSQRLPVLMLTARGDDLDKIVGLEIGADDYLAKPFNPRELLARIKAILRRAQPSDDDDQLVFGSLVIDRAARQARLRGVPCDLTGHQFDLLLALAEHAGRVLSREQLMDFVRGENLDAFDRSIDVHISRIRAAIEVDPRHPRRILTSRGAGYVFAKAQD